MSFDSLPTVFDWDCLSVEPPGRLSKFSLKIVMNYSWWLKVKFSLPGVFCEVKFDKETVMEAAGRESHLKHHFIFINCIHGKS